MKNFNGWTAPKPKHEMGKAPCQNCGEMVEIMLPFVGCVFCRDCMSDTDSFQASASEFKKRSTDIMVDEILEKYSDAWKRLGDKYANRT